MKNPTLVGFFFNKKRMKISIKKISDIKKDTQVLAYREKLSIIIDDNGLDKEDLIKNINRLFYLTKIINQEKDKKRIDYGIDDIMNNIHTPWTVPTKTLKQIELEKEYENLNTLLSNVLLLDDYEFGSSDWTMLIQIIKKSLYDR